MDVNKFESRKAQHIRYALDSANQAAGMSGLDSVHLKHEALPDLDFAEIDLRAHCLDSILPTPFYVAGMTAGHDQAQAINRTLALVCEKRGWAMGVGSQRRDLEAGAQGHSRDWDDWKRLREEVPNLVLFANLGISQLIGAKIADVQRLVQSLSAQALVVHLNALQEVMQPEGTPQFRGSFTALKRYSEELGLPVVVKETGCGFSQSTLNQLASLPLAAVDVSGLGGTHWGRIEGARAQPDSIRAAASRTFANWGETTLDSVRSAVHVLPSRCQIWASGGVRTGLEAAKLIALGAHRVGYALPALQSALKGKESLDFWMETQEFELRTALFCTGSINCEMLRSLHAGVG